MKDILADLDRWQQQGEEIALATLVCVRGSAPRLPGARLGVTRSGRMAGSVSGGCVENDVVERALLVLDGGEPVVATYGIADDLGVEVGLSCGGSIDVLIEPLAMTGAWQALRQAIEQQRPAALAVGLSPAALLGRKLAVLGDEAVIGSIDSGDTGLDAQVTAEARRLLRAGGARLATLRWRDQEACVFIEAFPPQPQLFIIGATHTAIPLCRMAKELGFGVTVIDPRSRYANRERLPEADHVVQAWPGEALDACRLDAFAYVVTLTHDPKFDLPTLTRALRSEAPYIGAIGSRGTHARRQAKLREAGFTEMDLARIRSPIGLDIGGRTPEEIALAILAEILAVRSGRDGRPLMERNAAIHDDR